MSRVTPARAPVAPWFATVAGHHSCAAFDKGVACHAVRAQMRGDLSKSSCRACLKGQASLRCGTTSTWRLEISVGRRADWPGRTLPPLEKPLRQRQAQPRCRPQCLANVIQKDNRKRQWRAQGLQKCPPPTLMQGGMPPPSLVAYTGKDSAVSNERRR